MGCHSGLDPPPGRFFALRVWLHFLWDVCHGVLNGVRSAKRAATSLDVQTIVCNYTTSYGHIVPEH